MNRYFSAPLHSESNSEGDLHYGASSTDSAGNSEFYAIGGTSACHLVDIPAMLAYVVVASSDTRRMPSGWMQIPREDYAAKFLLMQGREPEQREM